MLLKVESELKKSSTKPYPKIMECKNDGKLVLFTDGSRGTVIKPGDDNNWSIGDFYGKFKQDSFNDYCGVITIEQK